MNDFKYYKRALDELTEVTKTLENVAKDMEEIKVVKQLQLVRKWMEEQDLLIATVGEVSVGKSTFMNALLRQPVLPVAAKESTALVTYVKHGKQLRAGIYIDGKCILESHDLDEFNAFYTVNSKKWNEDHLEVDKSLFHIQRFKQLMTKKNESGDNYIEIQANNPILEHRIQIIDTPGLNDAGGIRSVMTKMFVGKADAIIMLLRADKLLSHSELGFFTDFVVKKHLEHVFILVNRFDKLSVSDQERVKEAAYKKFLDVGVPQENIFFVSARQAMQADMIDHYLESASAELPLKTLKKLTEGLTEQEIRNVLSEKSSELRHDSGLTNFFTRLETFLVENKGEGRLQKVKVELEAIGERILNTLEDTRQQLDGSREEITLTIKQNKKEREQAIKAMKGVKRMFFAESNKEKLALVKKFEEVIEDIERDVIQETKQANNLAEKDIERLLELRTIELTKEIERWVGSELPNIERKIRELYKVEYGKKLPTAKKTTFSLSIVESDFIPEVRGLSSSDNTDYIAAGGAAAGLGAATLLGAGVFGALLFAPIAAAGAVLFFSESNQSSPEKIKERLLKELKKMYTQARKEMRRELQKGFDDSINAWVLEMEESLQLEYDATDKRLKRMEEQMMETGVSLKNELAIVEKRGQAIRNQLSSIRF